MNTKTIGTEMKIREERRDRSIVYWAQSSIISPHTGPLSTEKDSG